MRFLATIRAIRACALALWLGVGLSLLTAIPVIIKFRAADQMRACEIVNTLILNAGKARLVLALLALATQAVLFYSRSTAAPQQKGWRRFASVLLVMAAMAAAIAVEFSLSLTLVLSHSGAAAAARVAPQAQLQLSLIGMALLVLEMILVAAALATGAADTGKIENRKSKI